MLKKFTEGLVFGSGFAISFIAIWYIATYSLYPMLISSITQKTNQQFSDIHSASPPAPEANSETAIPFHELGIDEQIKKASVIALARYEKSADGKMKAVIKEFLKKESGVTIYYNIGDEYPSSSYYPKKNTIYGDGIVMFFIGSPAKIQMSMTYSGDRISGLGDLPVELFRKKCEEPNA